jgi:hypothetical protein
MTIRLSRTRSAPPIGSGTAGAATSGLWRGAGRPTAAATLGEAGLAARLRCRLTRSAATAVALLSATTLSRRLLPLRGSAATFGSRRLLRLDPLAAGLLPLLALLGPTALGRRLLPLLGCAATFGSRRLLRLDPLAAGLLPLLALLGPTALGRRLLPLFDSAASLGLRGLLVAASLLPLRRLLPLLLLALLRLLLARTR